MASPPGIARLGHTAVTVVYARAIFNLSSGKVGPLVALLLRVGNLVILGYFSKSLFDSIGSVIKWDAIIILLTNNLVCLFKGWELWWAAYLVSSCLTIQNCTCRIPLWSRPPSVL